MIKLMSKGTKADRYEKAAYEALWMAGLLPEGDTPDVIVEDNEAHIYAVTDIWDEDKLYELRPEWEIELVKLLIAGVFKANVHIVCELFCVKPNEDGDWCLIRHCTNWKWRQ